MDDESKTEERLKVFCISAYRKPRLTSLPSKAFSYENRKKFRRLCFSDTKTIIIVPRGKHLAFNKRGEDFYQMVTMHRPDVRFLGTVFVLSYTQDHGPIELRDINRQTIQHVNTYMTVCECLDSI